MNSLRFLLETCGYKRKDLRHITDVSPNTAQKWLHGDNSPSKGMMRLIALYKLSSPQQIEQAFSMVEKAIIQGLQDDNTITQIKSTKTDTYDEFDDDNLGPSQQEIFDAEETIEMLRERNQLQLTNKSKMYNMTIDALIAEAKQTLRREKNGR